MAPNIFLTGATGYIGGTAHAYLAKAHPDYEFTLLVRNEQQAKLIKDKYPDTKFAYGTLDDAAVVEKAAAEADIVVHTADSSDNVPGAAAIAKGITAGHSAEKPGYWIHVTGTAILMWYDTFNKRYGEAPLPDQKYDDIDGIQRLVTLPDDAFHRNVDKIVQNTISDAVKVAMVCPPTIYGTGSGVSNTRSVQVPHMVARTLNKGFAPIVGAGLTEWDHVHIDDLGDLFVKLVDATQDPSLKDNTEVFGLNGYFLAENGSHKWSDVARWIAADASKAGYLPEPQTKTVSQEEAVEMAPLAGPTWGLNSKGVAQRANKYLGWTPKGAPLREEVTSLVPLEAQSLGLTPKQK